MAYSAYLHTSVWNPNTDPRTGCFEELLNQSRYPTLFSLSKKLTDVVRPYIDMQVVYDIRSDREHWQSWYFRYPATFTDPIDALTALYLDAVDAKPDNNVDHPYFDPGHVKRFISLVNKQRQFVHQFANAYVHRTKTHHESMWNNAQDEERCDDIAAGILFAARAQWVRMP